MAEAGGRSKGGFGGKGGGKGDPPKRGNFGTLLMVFLVLMILFDPNLRALMGLAVGSVLEPVIGFNGNYPVLTVVIAGSLMVALTTLVRHFTTDWLNMARTQAYMRHFQKEFSTARKENNTFRLKALQDKQPEVMAKQQEMSTKQLKTMPLTMIIVIPLFAWLYEFVAALDYWFYSVPWNPTIDMFGRNGIIFGSSLFPHWILLYMVVSIPFGALLQKAMKFLSWKERWQDRHPEVHEG